MKELKRTQTHLVQILALVAAGSGVMLSTRTALRCATQSVRTLIWEYRMKHNVILVLTSLLSILLLTLHITDDIVRGISKAESSNTALLVLVLFLYGTLVLASGGRFGARYHAARRAVRGSDARHPHERGALRRDCPVCRRVLLRLDTLGALGGLGGVTFILSALGLWNLRRGQPT